MHLSNAHPSLSCEASPYRYISRAVFVSFMFPEEGLITESARNVTFHLLFFYFRIQRLLFAQGWLPQSPSPRGPPNRGDRGDYGDRSRRRSRARREWSGAPPLPPSGGPSPLTGRTPLLELSGLYMHMYGDTCSTYVHVLARL